MKLDYNSNYNVGIEKFSWSCEISIQNFESFGAVSWHHLVTKSTTFMILAINRKHLRYWQEIQVFQKIFQIVTRRTSIQSPGEYRSIDERELTRIPSL